MGRDRDSNHEVSGRDLDRDLNFTQPSDAVCCVSDTVCCVRTRTSYSTYAASHRVPSSEFCKRTGQYSLQYVMVTRGAILV